MEITPKTPQEELIVTGKEEIVVKDDSAELTTYQFNRVDMEEPRTILEYGQDIQDQIVEILRSTAEMSINQEEDFITDEMLKKITSFDESLEEADKQAAKEENAIVRFAKKLLVGAGVKSVQQQEKLKTYKGRYEEYIENIRQVVEQVEFLKQNALSDIELRKSIAEKMKPLIDNLEVIINAGKEDKEAYDTKTSELAAADASLDGQHLVQKRKMLSDIFADKLNKLSKAVILYKAQLQEYAVQQNNDMISVLNADSYIRDQAPLLASQGSAQVFNKIQSERIESLATLNEASNVAIQNNAQELESNTQQAVDLMVNGGFSTESLSSVQQSLQRGIETIKNGRVLLQQKIEKDKKVLTDVNNLLDENQHEILGIIEQTSSVIGETQGKTPYQPTFNRPKTKRKKLGR